jgi:hypothetical protein
MNVTEQFSEYRDACVNFWNKHFVPRVPHLTAYETIDDFYSICSALFNVIVLSEVPFNASSPLPLRIDVRGKSHEEIEEESQQRRVHLEYHVIPKRINVEHIVLFEDFESSKELDLGKMDFRLIGFFDWDEIGIREFEFLQVRAFPAGFLREKRDVLLGKDMLLPFKDCEIHVHEFTEERRCDSHCAA